MNGDSFVSDIRTLHRYGIDKVELPVRKVMELIDTVDVFAGRLRALCPILVGDEVTVGTPAGEKLGHVTAIFIGCTDGKADIAIDTCEDPIDFEAFERAGDGWYVKEG